MAEGKEFRSLMFEQRKGPSFPRYAKIEYPAFTAVSMALQMPCNFHTRNFVADIEVAIEDVAIGDGLHQLFLASEGMINLGVLVDAATDKDMSPQTSPSQLIARYFRLCGFFVGSGSWSRYRASYVISWDYRVPMDIHHEGVFGKSLT